VAVPLTRAAAFVRPLGFIYRRGMKLPPSARRFIELLQQDTSPNGEHIIYERQRSAPAGVV
jgi:hypothetical protein